MATKQEISIWFFIGVSLVVNGALILGAGLYEWLIQPPAHPVVLYNLHASVWWGALLLIGGAVYCVKFAPQRSRAETAHEGVRSEEATATR